MTLNLLGVELSQEVKLFQRNLIIFILIVVSLVDLDKTLCCAENQEVAFPFYACGCAIESFNSLNQFEMTSLLNFVLLCDHVKGLNTFLELVDLQNLIFVAQNNIV